MENARDWELISQVSMNPAESLMNGFTAYLNFLKIVIYICSILGIIAVHALWAAILIFVFSVPLLWLSIRAGKKNYHVTREAEKFNRRAHYLFEVLTGRNNVEERTLFNYVDEMTEQWMEQYEGGVGCA